MVCFSTGISPKMVPKLSACTHRVQQGESVASLAEQSGFFELTLWNWPENAGLSSGHRRSTVLAPGDLVVIPPLRQKRVAKPTDARHVFRRHGIPAVYRLRVLDDDEPVAGAAYSFTVDGKEKKGSTDEQGCLEEFVHPSAKAGLLVIASIGLRARVQFGHLDPTGYHDPAGLPTGAEKRLSNLGYLRVNADSDRAQNLRSALRAFQFDHDLPQSGECDVATITALEKAHDFPH